MRTDVQPSQTNPAARWGLLIALVLILGGGWILINQVPQGGAATQLEPAPVKGHPAPEIALVSISGQPLTLSEFRGQPVVINFWATWCAPCRREIPLLKEIQAKYGENNVQVIGVAVDFVEQVAAYAEHAEFNYPILVGQKDAMAAAEATGIDFIGMPFTMIVAPDGQLIKTHLGEIIEEHLELIVEVFERMRTGELDIAGARSLLEPL